MITDGWTRWIFESRFLRFFGYISFSLYLFSEFLITPINRAIDSLAGFVIAVIITTVPICWLSFVIIERPLSRMSLTRWRTDRRTVGVN
jgi:peptidoglycan/LPS O-acetylase OafA/YrhL